MMPTRVALVTALLGVAAFAVVRPSSASNQAGSPSFTKDVAPIMFKSCVTCHRAGEIAPLSLMTYKEIRPWARAIREKVISREMPPWHADPQHGEWSNDRRISEKEIDTIVRWIDTGAKEGDARDLPPAPKFVDGWQIGEPEQIFYMPEEFTVPADGSVPYKYFTVPTNYTEDKYITALEARAGDLSVVHHIVIYVREPGDQQPKKRDIGTGLLGALSPGMTPFMAKPGTAKLIKAGSQLVFQMHYTPSGKVTKDRSLVGLKFARGPVERVITTTAAYDMRFVIPANAPNHEVKAVSVIDEDTEIVSFSPHMHLRGRDFTYRAIYPDGRSEVLLSVPRYDFNWQVYYYPKKPLKMPKGTRIEGIAHFDNSTKNALNPDPGRDVRFGEQTWEEMMNGFYDYTTNVKQLNKSASAEGSSGRE